MRHDYTALLLALALTACGETSSETGNGSVGGTSGLGGDAGSAGVGGGAGVSGGWNTAGSTGAGGATTACNDLELPPAAGCEILSGQPAPTGGTIPDGTYHMTLLELPECGESMPATALRYHATSANTYVVEAVDTFLGVLRRENGTWSTSGTGAATAVTCGDLKTGGTAQYSVLEEGSTVLLRGYAEGLTVTYMRVGD